MSQIDYLRQKILLELVGRRKDPAMKFPRLCLNMSIRSKQCMSVKDIKYQDRPMEFPASSTWLRVIY